MDKTYKVNVRKKGRDLVFEGTILRLTTEVFGYTLEVGESWDHSVNRHPKTIKSLIKNLQKAYEAKEAQCYERSYVTLVD